MNQIEHCPQELIDCGHALADIARPIALDFFCSALPIDYKSDQSPVTIADRIIEEKIREYLSEHRPNDGVLGEEFGHTNPDAEWQWILDPIDGTKAFIAGSPGFATLIGLMRGDQFVMGFCDQPTMKRRWVGAAGYPTTLNGEDVSIRRDVPENQWIACTTNPLRFEPDIIDFFQKWRRDNGFFHCAGSTKPAQVASGWVDCAFCGDKYGFYDIAAFMPIIEGAGGYIRTLDGQRFSKNSQGYLVVYGDERVWQYISEHIGIPA